MSAQLEAELTGRLMAGRQGFLLVDSKGVRWPLKIERKARDFLGQTITVVGQKSASLMSVRQYAVAKPVVPCDGIA